ncbi:hypothetical protein ACFQZE_23765 [Paenibacillus sp. GCM10027627]|uniref:hypothetical protein n=1 Tax=unclassified Paenibacillus TaxID=185978 RepID=UPI0036382B90
MELKKMLDLFEGFNDLDKRGLIIFLRHRMNAAYGDGVFEKYFKEYLELSDERDE